MTSPAVSVILPFFNNERSLAAAARSILRQTMADLELILIDDGSTDGSWAVAEQLRDPRIRLYRNERNLGVSTTRNRGIELMRGEFMAPMDADDVSTPRRLERTVSAMRANPALGFCGGWARWSGWGTMAFVVRHPCGPATVNAYSLYSMPSHHDTLLFRGEMLRMHQLAYDEHLRSTVDFDLVARCLKVADGDNVPAVLVQYVHNPSSITATRKPKDSLHRLNLIKEPLERLLSGQVDDALLRRHAAIGNGTGAESLSQLAEYRTWLEKLETANLAGNVFDPAGMHAATAMVWFRCCRNSAHLGAGAWRAWRNSPWSAAYRPAPAESASFLGTWLVSRMVPSRRRPQGHFQGLHPPADPPCTAS